MLNIAHLGDLMCSVMYSQASILSLLKNLSKNIHLHQRRISYIINYIFSSVSDGKSSVVMHISTVVQCLIFLESSSAVAFRAACCLSGRCILLRSQNCLFIFIFIFRASMSTSRDLSASAATMICMQARF